MSNKQKEAFSSMKPLLSYNEVINGVSVHFASSASLSSLQKRNRRVGPTVIFVHGAASNHRNWEMQYHELGAKEEWNIIAVDLPGHGQSEWFPSSPLPDVKHYALVLLQLLGRWSLDNIWLVGHSMGGAIIQELVLQAVATAPAMLEVIRGLIIVGSGARLPVSPSLLRLLEENPSEAMERLLKWSIYKEIATEDPSRYQHLLEFTRSLFSHSSPDVTLFDFRACAQFDVHKQLHLIQVPTGIIVGQNDVMTPPSLSEELHDGLPTSLGLVKIPRAGHLVMLERPSQVNEIIIQWVEEQAF